jgi:regulator of replication initiation timing
MVDNSPISSHNNSEKGISPFKKMLDGVKNFLKKNDEDNKLSSFEASKIKKNQDPSIPKLETSETKKSKRSTRERKANSKEQRLPKKFKKGW